MPNFGKSRFDRKEAVCRKLCSHQGPNMGIHRVLWDNMTCRSRAMFLPAGFPIFNHDVILQNYMHVLLFWHYLNRERNVICYQAWA
jgi:hypothetical protein